MALFSKREPCAICGGKVKGLLPWRVDGQLICNDCFGIADLPDGMVNSMTLDEFRGYLSFREANGRLKDDFQTTTQIDFGFMDTKIIFDEGKRLMCMDTAMSGTVFEGSQIVSFSIREDEAPLFEGSAEGLRCYDSAVPSCIRALDKRLSVLRMKQELRNLGRPEQERTSGIDISEPFKKFNVEIRFRHPYWEVKTADMNGPTFGSEPDPTEYLAEYRRRADTMGQLARALMAIAFPGAPEQVIRLGDDPQETAQSAAPVDAVAEIRRYKELMDQGILTPEEFAAKKKQLMGI